MSASRPSPATLKCAVFARSIGGTRPSPPSRWSPTIELRNLLRRESTDDPIGFALAWAAATDASVEPWYRDTLHFDRHRLAEAEAQARGEAYEPGDPVWDTTRAMEHAAGSDPEVLRGYLSIVGLLATAGDVLGQPGLIDKVESLGAGWRDAPALGPDRAQLVKLIND